MNTIPKLNELAPGTTASHAVHDAAAIGTLDLLRKCLSDAGIRNFLNGDPIKLYPNDITAIIEAARCTTPQPSMPRATTGDLVEWTLASVLPDSDTTVMLFSQEADEAIWLGYHDGTDWYYVDGMPAAPTSWANMPGGPAS